MKLINPLAQSFYVEPDCGIFVTSIDLFFSTKDNELPLTVQLRPMKLGLPTSEVYPFSEVVLKPSDISTSDDASVATRVTFLSPVYLTGKQFHSIVLLSNSNNHNVWISRLGETDKTLELGEEARNVLVTNQPLSGSLFKSSNGTSWNPSLYEDLKFTLYRANFESTGNISFYNPELQEGNEEIATLVKDSLSINSRKIRIGLGVTISSASGISTVISPGNTIVQFGSNASGDYVGVAGSAYGALNLINAGIGYTPSTGSQTFSNVSLTSVTGNGANATANISISNGVAIAATIVNGGTGYVVGDVVTAPQVGVNSLGRNLRFSISNLSGINQIILDQVQGDFTTGVGNTIQFVNGSGVTTPIGIGSTVFASVTSITTENDGLHIKVNHKNHGMHSTQNVVKISNTKSDVSPSRLTEEYVSTSSGSITISDVTSFGTFENVGVGSTNLGYALIGDEIISYSSVVTTTSPAGQLTGITRGVDQTFSFTYPVNTPVYKYELNGVSLRRINKTHLLSSATVSNPIGLDYYNVKVDMTANGTDRSVGTSFPKLYFKTTKSTGGDQVKATQNIQYEIIRPVVQTMALSGTNVSASIRTVTGKSISGSENSFVDKNFENISLDKTNYLDSPRLIASKVNEDQNLSTLPGKKSFTMNLNLNSSNSYLSPVVDLDRVSVILSSNRVNSVITNYTTDGRTASLREDPSSFVYATKPIELQIPATAIKVILTAYVNQSSDLRLFYAIQQDPTFDPIYYPFPGYSNINADGVVNVFSSDGSSDVLVPKTDSIGFESDELIFRDYEFTIDQLPSFRYFSIKLIGTSTNQVYPPRVRDLRIIALA